MTAETTAGESVGLKEQQTAEMMVSSWAAQKDGGKAETTDESLVAPTAAVKVDMLGERRAVWWVYMTAGTTDEH